jgi:hypothetical protein
MASSTNYKNTKQGRTRHLETGKIYTGTVEATNPVTNTCVVRIDHGRYRVDNCQWASGIISGMLGVKTNYLPPPNTRVLVVYGGATSFVVGSTQGSVPYAVGSKSRTHTGQEAKMNLDARKLFSGGTGRLDANGTSPAADMLEGEFELSNLLGVGITLLTGLAKLSAGDLAKVECCLLNDMVRIVSQTFKHYSALGDFEIYNDGRLNARWKATSYDHEAWGREKSTDEKVPQSGPSKIDVGSVDALNDTLRERFSQFVGFLGDFINTYVTDPATTLGAAAQPRSGKFRLHVNNDGGVLVQSVSDIVLERVCRIVVPIERKRWDDPTGTLAEEYDKLSKGPLKAWEYSQNPDNIFHAAYQLRHYARWLAGLHGLARFHQNIKDWEVPTEEDTPAPQMVGSEADKLAANPETDSNYIETYATIRIMRDGSITLLDGYGSSVMLAGGNVQVSATKHLTLEAAGDVNIVAGQNMNLKARRSIEIVATRGGLVLKSKAWLRAICELGSIWFRTDAPDPASAGYSAPIPTDTTEDPAIEVLPSAFVFQSSKGRFSVEAKNAVNLQVQARSLAEGEDAAISLVSPDGKVRILAKKDVEIGSQIGKLLLKARQEIVVSATRFMNYLSGGVFDINGSFTVRPGGFLDVVGIRTRQLFSTVVFSRRLPGGAPTHENHVLSIPPGSESSPSYSPVPYGSRSGDDVDSSTLGSELYNDPALNPVAAVPDAADGKRPTFNDDYLVTQLLETMSQQQLRNEAPATHDTWQWSTDGLLGEMASERGYPWPGTPDKCKDLQYVNTSSLKEPSPVAYNSLANSAAALQKKTKQFKFLKLENS